MRLRHWPLVALVGFAIGGALAAVGNWAGWRTETPPPVTMAEAQAAIRAGLPDRPAEPLGWHDDAHDFGLPDDIPLTAYNLPAQLTGGSYPDQLGEQEFTRARDRLAAAGWEIGDVTTRDGRGHFFVASRDGVNGEWTLEDGLVGWWFWRHEPLRISVFTVLGWLAGAAAGWGLIRLLLRRAPSRGRLAVLVLVALLALAGSFPAGWAALMTGHNLAHREVANGQPQPVWFFYAVVTGDVG
ncbi:hypothetical protein [Catellatospora vulcania]|uniref:hypothetical protein n=1 Tax=Catellatospora vulcania TaxID=1460450 RepID=UPI0012D43474|nr:hypothetical protein [Catellatospora vulcania]